MKLYDFVEWEKRKRNVRLTEVESDEALFKKEFSKVKKGWTVVDVGARVGYYTIKAGRLVGKSGKVLSIEPHPETYRVLKKNIELHRLNNVIPVCKAVGNKIGEVKLYEGMGSGATTVVSPRPIHLLDRDRFVRWLKFVKSGNILKILRKTQVPVRYVPIDTLDRIAKQKNIGKIDLIKIDVEGVELAVLKGSHDVLRKDKPRLLVEIHPTLNSNPETLYELLRNYGYSLKMQKRSEFFPNDMFGKVYVLARFNR